MLLRRSGRCVDADRNGWWGWALKIVPASNSISSNDMQSSGRVRTTAARSAARTYPSRRGPFAASRALVISRMDDSASRAKQSMRNPLAAVACRSLRHRRVRCTMVSYAADIMRGCSATWHAMNLTNIQPSIAQRASWEATYMPGKRRYPAARLNPSAAPMAHSSDSAASTAPSHTCALVHMDTRPTEAAT